MDCLGCRIANGREPDVHIVYENELVACVLDIAPFNEGHTLILPKKHYREMEELDSATACAMMEALRKLSAAVKGLFQPDGISICQNGGRFNDLAHCHVHLIPRYEGDGFSWSEPLRPHGAEKRLSETRAKMAKALSEK